MDSCSRVGRNVRLAMTGRMDRSAEVVFADGRFETAASST
jgi:hypothetical protein